MKRLFKLFISLECKCNKLQFGIRTSSIDASKQKLRISTAIYVYNKTYSKEIHTGATPFSRAKGFSVSQYALVSILHFSVDEYPESAVEAWKRYFLSKFRTSQPLLFFVWLLYDTSQPFFLLLLFCFCLRDRLTRK